MESLNLAVRKVSIGDKFILDNMHWREIEIVGEPFTVDRYPAYTQVYVSVKITDDTLKEIVFGDRLLSLFESDNALKIN